MKLCSSDNHYTTAPYSPIILFSNITSSMHKTGYMSVVSAFMKEVVLL